MNEQSSGNVDDVAEQGAGLGVGEDARGSRRCPRSRRRRGSGRPGRSAGRCGAAPRPGARRPPARSRGATTVTTAPQSSRPLTFSCATRPAPTTRTLGRRGRRRRRSGASPALRRRSRRAGPRSGRAGPPPRRRRRRARSGTCPDRSTSIRNESSDRPFRVASAAETERAVSASPAPRGQPPEEAERRLLAARPVNRADPAGLEPELQHPLELRGLLGDKLAALDRGRRARRACAVALVAGGRQHGLNLAERDLALLRLDRDD